jgi:uncharacterized protein (UPF0548 family)
VIFVQPRRTVSIERALARAQLAEPTFTNRLANPSEGTPHGFRRISRSVTVGEGADAFDRASEGIRTWRGHDLRWLRVYPVATSPKRDRTVIVTVGSKFVSIAAPCRITTVIDEVDRCGFVYATLPGHPEQGEESFIVSIDEEGTVRFHIAAISAPADWLTRTAGPLGHAAQSVATYAYLRSMRRFVRNGTTFE